MQLSAAPELSKAGAFSCCAELCADRSDQTPLQQMGHTEVGMHWTCHLLHRTLHRYWQSHQPCGGERVHVREELTDQQRARPA